MGLFVGLTSFPLPGPTHWVSKSTIQRLPTIMNNDHGLCLTLFAAQYLNMNFPIFFKQGKDKLLPKSDKKIDNLKLIEN